MKITYGKNIHSLDNIETVEIDAYATKLIEGHFVATDDNSNVVLALDLKTYRVINVTKD